MSNRKLPTKVSILGVPFTIEYRTDLKCDGEDVMGLTTGSERKISICVSKNDSPEKIESVLAHEIMHAILYVTGHSETIDEKVEEAVVLALEHGLTQLYRRKFK